MAGEHMTIRRESAAPAGAPFVGVNQLLYNEADGGLYVKLPDGEVRKVNVPPSDARANSGDARGAGALDLQYTRLLATQVSSGVRSGVIGGSENAAAALESITLGGLGNVAFRDQAGVGGKQSIAGGKQSFAWGNQAICGGFLAFTDYDSTTRVLSGLDETWSSFPSLEVLDATVAVAGMMVYIAYDFVPRAAVIASVDVGAKTITLVANPAGLGDVVSDFVTIALPGKSTNYAQAAFGEVVAAFGLASFVGAGQNSLAEGMFAAALATESSRAKGRASVVIAATGGNTEGNYSFLTGRYGKVTGQSGFKQGERGEVEGNSGLAMGYYPHSRLWGQRAFSSGVINGVLGRGQHTELELVLQTVDATPTVVQIAENQGGFVFEDDKVYWVQGYALAVNLGAAEYASYTFKGLFHRGTGAASVTLVSAGVVQTEHETVAGWAFAMAADTSGGGVKFTCTGEAGKNIDWLVHVEAGELASV